LPRTRGTQVRTIFLRAELTVWELFDVDLFVRYLAQRFADIGLFNLVTILGIRVAERRAKLAGH
jgi:hypothetical protein